MSNRPLKIIALNGSDRVHPEPYAIWPLQHRQITWIDHTVDIQACSCQALCQSHTWKIYESTSLSDCDQITSRAARSRFHGWHHPLTRIVCPLCGDFCLPGTLYPPVWLDEGLLSQHRETDRRLPENRRLLIRLYKQFRIRADGACLSGWSDMIFFVSSI